MYDSKFSTSSKPETTVAQDTRQRGQKWASEGEGFRGQSEGSREVPMVQTPAGPLGNRTPSRGRSQRRDTSRGPALICVRISTQIISSSKADVRLSRLSRARAPETNLKLKRHGFKNSQARSFWCRSRPVAPRTRGFESTCPCRVAPSCYLWEIQLT